MKLPAAILVSLAAVSSSACSAGGAPVGAAPPLIHLGFEGNLDNRGSAAIEMHAEGDGVRFDHGIEGQALFVDGSEDWVEGPVPEGFDLSAGGTLELWVMRDDWVNPYGGGAGGQMFATIDALMLDISVYNARDPSNNRLRGMAQAVGFDIHRATSEQRLAPLTWTHVAVVYDGAAREAIYYVDGEEAARAEDVPPLVDRYPNPFKIGTWHRQNQQFRGWIDELRLYDYALTAEQIARSAARAQ